LEQQTVYRSNLASGRVIRNLQEIQGWTKLTGMYQLLFCAGDINLSRKHQYYSRNTEAVSAARKENGWCSCLVNRMRENTKRKGKECVL